VAVLALEVDGVQPAERAKDAEEKAGIEDLRLKIAND
jgi:hypothetical protein